MHTHDRDAQVLTITAVIEEDQDMTDAKVTMTVRGQDFAGWGRARRTPEDPSIPAVGEELAIARALHQLSGHLLEAAATTIERYEGVRPDLHT